MRRFLKRLQLTPALSHLSAALIRPFYRVATRISGRVPWAIKVNGARVSCEGIHLVFPANTGVMYSTLIYWRGNAGYEAATWGVLKSLFAKAGTFLDIGSNIGLYAVLAKKLHPQLRVHAFEPVPSLAEGNRRFHAANGLSEAQVHQLAMSDAKGSFNMTVPQFDGVLEAEPTSTLQAGVHLSPGASEQVVQVQTDTVSGFLAAQQAPGPLLMKIDVEGHEASVLRGAMATLVQRRPVILCEMLPGVSRHEEVGKLLIEARYDVWAVCREGLFRFALPDLARPRDFTDFLLTPRENSAPETHFLPIAAAGDLLR